MVLLVNLGTVFGIFSRYVVLGVVILYDDVFQCVDEFEDGIVNIVGFGCIFGILKKIVFFFKRN